MGQSNRQLKDSILRTLHYHNLFDYPLTHKEIYRFLCGNFQFFVPRTTSLGLAISNFQFENTLRNLVKTKQIFKKDNFYFLPKKENIVNLRKKKAKYSQEKIKIAKKIVQLIKFIPWIKMVGITGALAMNNSREDDDIDLLITTIKNRLWLTRFLLIIILEILSKRRRPQDKNYKNKMCLNMFLDEKALYLSKDKHNLFTAHEIIQMKPILNKHNTYEKFLKANLWVKDFLPNSLDNMILGYDDIKKKNKKSPNIQISPAFVKASAGRQYPNIPDFIENLIYQLQLKYMKSKITREEINSHFAFFHPKNRTKEILKKYYSIFSKLPASLHNFL